MMPFIAAMALLLTSDASLSNGVAAHGAQDGSSDPGSTAFPDWFGTATIGGVAGGTTPECVGDQHTPCDTTWTTFADHFGNPAISGRWAVVGKRGDKQGGFNSGAIYTYRLIDGLWAFDAKIKADPPVTDERLGNSVAIDGTLVVAGAPWASPFGIERVGRLIVFRRNAQGLWSEEAELTVPPQLTQVNDKMGGDLEFRECVAAGAPGGFAVGGAPLAAGLTESSEVGYVAVFHDHPPDGQNPGGWEMTDILWAQTLDPSLPEVKGKFGAAVGIDENRLVIGEPDRGRGQVYVLRHGPGGWLLEQILEPPADAPDEGSFGRSLAIEGRRIAVAAPDHNQAYIFEYDADDEAWVLPEDNVLTHPEADYPFAPLFGWSVAVSGPQVLVGYPGHDSIGGALLFQRQLDCQGNPRWEPIVTLVPDVELLGGFSHVMAIEAASAIVGAPHESPGGDQSGAAYFFTELPSCFPYLPECE